MRTNVKTLEILWWLQLLKRQILTLLPSLRFGTVRSEVRILSPLGHKRTEEFVFVNPKTEKAYTDIKKGFRYSVDYAELRNLEWQDLRAILSTSSSRTL